MSDIAEAALRRGEDRYRIEVADESLTFRSISIDDLTPTGEQLARAAGFKPPDGAVVLQMLADGALELIRPEEVIDLRHQDGRFVIVASDRLYFLTIDGQRYDWPCRIVSGGLLRKLGAAPREQAIYLERIDHPDRPIGDHDLVDLDRAGIESFITRKAVWKLNVHGVVINVPTPTITVRAAMEQAGFDTTKPWHIYFKVVGEAKREVDLDTVLDLEAPGIEKLRLTPKNVDNGEAPQAPRHDFALLDIDTAYLDRLTLKWETIVEGGRRWLLIRNFPVPAGYTVARTLLALEIPPAYPGAAIYGFYAYPPLALASNRAIASTQLRGILLGVEFHGWSRYRGPAAPWNPAMDNVITQLGLVEAALEKEVGE
jgi:hypothetical protein